MAAPFIGIAFVLDMLDGRIARMTNTTSAFGVEFDSLADVISFGMAPAVLAFAWGLSDLGRVGWAAGFIYVTAAAMRLARFNIQSAGARRQALLHRHAVARRGGHHGGDRLSPGRIRSAGFPQSIAAVAIVLRARGVLMVSTIRFRSFKTINFGWLPSYMPIFLFAGAHRRSSPPSRTSRWCWSRTAT